MAEPLISSADLSYFGYDDSIDVAILTRVSAIVRRHTKQTITRATSVAKGRSPLVLPQYPVVSITSVVNAAGTAVTDYELNGSVLTAPYCAGVNDFEINLGTNPRSLGRLTVTYESGYDFPPDELRELCCAIAARLAGTDGVAQAGIKAREVGGESLTFAAESLSGSLTDREMDELDAMFPKHLAGPPRTVRMDPAW